LTLRWIEDPEDEFRANSTDAFQFFDSSFRAIIVPNGVVTSVLGGGIVQATADFNDDELTVFWPPRASLRGCSFLNIASMAPEIDCKMQSNPR
jgi:hypothetical protein